MWRAREKVTIWVNLNKLGQSNHIFEISNTVELKDMTAARKGRMKTGKIQIYQGYMWQSLV